MIGLCCVNTFPSKISNFIQFYILCGIDSLAAISCGIVHLMQKNGELRPLVYPTLDFYLAIVFLDNGMCDGQT